jgi:hypothetical protein
LGTVAFNSAITASMSFWSARAGCAGLDCAGLAGVPCPAMVNGRHNSKLQNMVVLIGLSPLLKCLLRKV